MTSTTVHRANAVTLIQLAWMLSLLLNLFISVCHGRPPASHSSGGIVSPLSDDDEPNVFAVSDVHDRVSGEVAVERLKVRSDDDDDDAEMTSRRRRHRRSTLGWLQTALRMCNMGFTSVDRRCRRIDVDDGQMHIKIILRDQ